MKSNKNGGFAAAWVVLIVLVLIVAGGIAWVHYVYLPKMAAQTIDSAKPASTSTITSAYPAGCISTSGYSSANGQPCSGATSTPALTTSTAILPSQSSNGSSGCGSDANCFIEAAKTCSPTTAVISVEQPIDFDLVNLTEQLTLGGKQASNCLFKANQTNATVELNQQVVQAYEAQAKTWVAQGQITQQQYDSGVQQFQDGSYLSKDQTFWDAQIGVSYDCSIPNSVLVPILKGWLISQPWSSTTTVDFSLADSGLNKYCKISAPNIK
jgi:hypothetical protein